MRLLATVVPLLLVPATLGAQNPIARPADAAEVRYATSQPVVQYIVHVDSTDLSGFGVEMRMSALPDTFRLAMVKHPEYDDRYWRYLDTVTVETATGPGRVRRLGDALWEVSAPGGRAIVRYRLKLPPPLPMRAAWKPFLARAGGLVGGTQSFLYVEGATLAPATVTLDLPDGWDAATGLVPTADDHTFFAPTVGVLVDSPTLIGKFSDWRFFVDGVPHRVTYWSLLPTLPFDTAAFVRGIEGVTRQAIALFGRSPYREYTFLFQDDAYGALEHLNSVTIGAPSAELAKDPNSLLGEIAHEYFHTWNLMRIRPAEYGDVSYKGQPPASGLWVSEGFTMLYADLLLRRAGLPTEDSTRADHLAHLIGRYLDRRDGYATYSAEQVSRVANETPGASGDYLLSTHLQGELLGTMLDLTIRNATHGARSLDDVMRALNERYSGPVGFSGKDVEGVVAEVCGCEVKRFFDTYVRRGREIAFDDYLRFIGLHTEVSWAPAHDSTGTQLPDLRVTAWMPPGARNPTLLLFTPEGAWGKAGLHTGDRILRMDGVAMTNPADFRSALQRLQIGQTTRLAIEHGGKTIGVTVVIKGYDIPSVRLVPNTRTSAAQRALREEWLAGAPGSDEG